ncbi:MAG: hypothetical protein V3V24_09800 [Nitrospinaceae bacterium]
METDQELVERVSGWDGGGFKPFTKGEFTRLLLLARKGLAAEGLVEALKNLSYLQEGICWCLYYPKEGIHSAGCEQSMKALAKYAEATEEAG